MPYSMPTSILHKRQAIVLSYLTESPEGVSSKLFTLAGRHLLMAMLPGPNTVPGELAVGHVLAGRRIARDGRSRHRAAAIGGILDQRLLVAVPPYAPAWAYAATVATIAMQSALW